MAYSQVLAFVKKHNDKRQSDAQLFHPMLLTTPEYFSQELSPALSAGQADAHPEPSKPGRPGPQPWLTAGPARPRTRQAEAQRQNASLTPATPAAVYKNLHFGFTFFNHPSQSPGSAPVLMRWLDPRVSKPLDAPSPHLKHYPNPAQPNLRP